MRFLLATLLLTICTCVQAAPVPLPPKPDPTGQAFLGIMKSWNEEGNGVVAGDIVPGSAAEKSGIRTGDAIQNINGIRPVYFFDLQDMIGMYRPGALIEIEVERNGKKIVLKARLSDGYPPSRQN